MAKKSRFKTVFYFLIIFVLVVCCESTSVAAKNKKTKEYKYRERASADGGIRTWLTNGHIKLLVYKTEISSLNPNGEAAEQGKRWFIVYVGIKNVEKFSGIYGGDYHKIMLLDSNLRYYKENIAKKISNWAEVDEKAELAPGASFKTAYVFSIPTDSIPIKIIFDPSSEDKYPLIKISL